MIEAHKVELEVPRGQVHQPQQVRGAAYSEVGASVLQPVPSVPEHADGASYGSCPSQDQVGQDGASQGQGQDCQGQDGQGHGQGPSFPPEVKRDGPNEGEFAPIRGVLGPHGFEMQTGLQEFRIHEKDFSGVGDLPICPP